MTAHIWWITRKSSLRFRCSGCARTLHISRSNKWSIGFCTLFATNITRYCASSHVTLCVIPYQHHTEIGTDMKKKNSPNEAISIPHRSYVSLNGWMVTLGVFVEFLFFIIDNQLGILSYQIRHDGNDFSFHYSIGCCVQYTMNKL